MNVAILLSGGMGTRIYSQIPKQYISVCDKRVITYSLETLVKCSLIDQIYIVADSEWRQVIQPTLSRILMLTDHQQHII